MVAPIRQIVTVGADGLIEVRAPGAIPGTRAEVVVWLEGDAATGGATPAPISGIAALDALQQSLHLDAEAAGQWVKDVRAERAAAKRPE